MAKEYCQKIKNEVLDKAHEEWDNLEQEKKNVLSILINKFMRRKVTQEAIIEDDVWLEKPTKREVRELIRQLRVQHQYPIISDSSGYTFPRDKAEAQEYIDRLENTVQSTIRSHHQTYKAMNLALGMDSAFFEQMELPNLDKQNKNE